MAQLGQKPHRFNYLDFLRPWRITAVPWREGKRVSGKDKVAALLVGKGRTQRILGAGRRGFGLVRRENLRGDEKVFAIGAEARGLPGDVSGGRWLRFGRANGLVRFGLGLHNGFVW
jgi:hypothetical protein